MSRAEWAPPRPGESEAVAPDGRRLRIKQSVGRPGSPDSFWYCYQWNNGWQYLGNEKSVDLAKSRCLSGKMKAPDDALAEWLKAHGDQLPPDLLDAETKRLAAWRKNPSSKAVTEPTVTGGIRVPGEGSAKRERTESRAAPPSPKSKKGERPTGRLPQAALVILMKREFTGRPGTKWRTRQEHIFACAGKSVKEIRDDDGLKNMLRDGQVRLEETS